MLGRKKRRRGNRSFLNIASLVITRVSSFIVRIEERYIPDQEGADYFIKLIGVIVVPTWLEPLKEAIENFKSKSAGPPEGDDVPF